MTKRKLGLALAGGGSLGAYEVGVLKRFKEKNYHFDVVTGTSIGGLNGAFVVMDEIEKLEQLWLEITPEKVMKDGININKDIRLNFNDDNLMMFLKNYALNKGADITPFKELCKTYIDPEKIINSSTAFGTICVSLPLVSEVKVDMRKLDKDHVLPFLHASSACVPVFPVENIDDKKYIDGFYRNNLPIDYCFELGADEIIAVDLSMFGLSPQNSFLMKLPIVDTIKPRLDLGSFMDFTHDVIVKNIRRGYNDAKKYFHELRGYRYSFEKSEDFDKYGLEFVHQIIVDINRNAKNTVKFLFDKVKESDFPISDNTSFLILALETLGEEFDIDDSIIYNHHDFFKLIAQKAMSQQTNALSFLSSAKNKLSKMYQKLVSKDEEPSKFARNDEEMNIFFLLNNLYEN